MADPVDPKNCNLYPPALFYGKPHFRLSLLRPANATTLCRNVMAWEDEKNRGNWFVEPLPQDQSELDWSQIPSLNKSTILHLTEGVRLVNTLGEPALVERV